MHPATQKSGDVSGPTQEANDRFLVPESTRPLGSQVDLKALRRLTGPPKRPRGASGPSAALSPPNAKRQRASAVPVGAMSSGSGSGNDQFPLEAGTGELRSNENYLVYRARENETARNIGMALGIDPHSIVQLNERRYDGLGLDSKLMGNTVLFTRRIVRRSGLWFDASTGIRIKRVDPASLSDPKECVSPLKKSKRDLDSVVTSSSPGVRVNSPIRYKIDPSGVDPPLSRIALPRGFSIASDAAETARALGELGLESLAGHARFRSATAANLADLTLDDVEGLNLGNVQLERQLLCLIYTLQELETVGEVAEGEVQATEWGFIPGTFVEDKRNGNMGTVGGVKKGKLVVDCAGFEQVYTRREAQAHLVLRDDA